MGTINQSFRFRLVILALFLVLEAGATRGQEATTDQDSSQMTCRQMVILGGVRNPGRLELKAKTSLIGALARAGGPNEGTGKALLLIHSCNCSPCSGKEREPQIYKLVDVLKSNQSGSSYVAPGDTVIVFDDPKVFVMNGSGSQELAFSENLTVTRAIALVGIVSVPGDLVLARIHRKSPAQDQRTIIVVDLKAIREGRTEDLLLQPWDVVEISDRDGHFGPPKRLPIWDTPIRPRKENSGS